MNIDFPRTLLGMLAWVLLAESAAARMLELELTQATEADVAVSPDGSHLVFSVLGHLVRVPVGGGVAEQLTFGACYDNDPAFSPDGTRIAFVSDRDGSGGNVFVLELAAGALTQVTHESRAGHPVWTPDGKGIVYLRVLPPEHDLSRPASIFGGPVLSELCRVPLGGDNKPETLRGPGLLKSVFYLSGDQLAWTVVEQESGGGGGFFPRSTTHIETIASKEGEAARLRSVPGDMGRVAASPRGDGLHVRTPEVAFLPLPEGPAPRMSPRPGGGSASRFAVTADGRTALLSDRGQLVQVTLASGKRDVIPFSARVKLEVADPVQPRWAPPEAGGAPQARAVLGPQLSPDGRQLLFMAAGFLWQQPSDGGPARRLLEGNAWECEPALSPDGRHLAFVTRQSGKQELRVLELEGRRARTLAALADGSRARYPAWSGDGRRLVFQRSDTLQSPFHLISVNLADGAQEPIASPAGDWSSRPHFAPRVTRSSSRAAMPARAPCIACPSKTTHGRKPSPNWPGT